MTQDNDYPLRCFEISALRKFLDGTFYDCLPHHFYQEEDNQGEKISLCNRRPCVQSRIAKIVVKDSTSLLFGNGHFPNIEHEDEEIQEIIKKIEKHCHLNKIMIESANCGSVGSVVIMLNIVKNRVVLKVKETEYLIPEFDDSFPTILVKLTEKYKIKGRDLNNSDYSGYEDEQVFWMVREWDDLREIRYIPYTPQQEKEDGFKPQIDQNRTIFHNIGRVPAVWIKNLSSVNPVDGECTFEPAILDNIELDYQLSQVGRGLRYSSDPTLIIQSDRPPIGQTLHKSPASALSIPTDGDAKFLEINGKAAEAVLAYAEVLRKTALENVHGNRANPEKLAAAHSGRALELLHLPLVWLADELRITYGQGLLNLIELIIYSTGKYKIILSGPFSDIYDEETTIIENLKLKTPLSLRWTQWFSPTIQDKLSQAQGLKTLNDGRLISQSSAIKEIAAEYEIQSVDDEILLIKKEAQELQEILSQNQVQIKETLPL